MESLLPNLQRIPEFDLGLWGVIFAGTFAVLAFLIIAEGRQFRRQGLGTPWLKLRIATLPILAVTIAAIAGIIRASGISGMEALAAAYLTLFTAGPLLYFGLHWLCGRMVGLRAGASLHIAFSGLLMLLSIPAVGHLLQPHVSEAGRARAESRINALPRSESPYVVADARRLQTSVGAELWAIHLKAGTGVRLDRLDLEMPNYSSKDALRTSLPTGLCRNADDLHLLWLAERPLPTLHLFWTGADGKAMQSTQKLLPPTGDASALTVVWDTDTVTLPVSIPGSRLAMHWEREGGYPFVENPSGISVDCAPLRLALKERHGLGLPHLLRLRIDLMPPKEPAWMDFRRPDRSSAPA